MAASTLTPDETSSGCNGGEQHLGEYANTSSSVSGSGTLEFSWPMSLVGGLCC